MILNFPLGFNSVKMLYILFGSELSLLIAIAHLLFSKGNYKNLFLSFFFLIISVLLLQYILFSYFPGFEVTYPFIFTFHISLLYLVGPILFVYCQMLVKPEIKLKRKYIPLFIPCVILVAIELGSLFIIDLNRDIVLSQIVKGYILQNHFSLYPLLRAGAYVQSLSLHVLILRYIFASWRLKEMNNIVRISVAVNVVIILYNLSLLLYTLTGKWFLFDGGLLLITTLAIFIFFMGFRYPQFLAILNSEIKKKKYEKSTIKTLDTRKVEENLHRLMEEDNLFCYEDITIKKLADELAITSHQLSEFLNNRLNMNFKTYINSYRIKDAKRLLVEEPDQTIITIAHAVGFNSPSAFYSAFSKYAGTTPQRFRQNHSKN